MNQPMYLPAMPQVPSYQMPYQAPDQGAETLPYYAPYRGSFSGTHNRAARGSMPLEISESPMSPASAKMSTSEIPSTATTTLPDVTAITTDEPTTIIAGSRNLATTKQPEDSIEYDYYYNDDISPTEAPVETKSFNKQVVVHLGASTEVLMVTKAFTPRVVTPVKVIDLCII